MKLEINKNMPKMVSVRLTDEIYYKIREMADKEQVPQTEICRALIEAALKEYNNKK